MFNIGKKMPIERRNVNRAIIETKEMDSFYVCEVTKKSFSFTIFTLLFHKVGKELHHN